MNRNWSFKEVLEAAGINAWSSGRIWVMKLSVTARESFLKAFFRNW